MIFNKFRTAMPISNNKIVGFGEQYSHNPSFIQNGVSEFGTQKFPNQTTPTVDNEKQSEENRKRESIARYKALVSRHNRLSQEIDRKNKT